MDFGNQGEEICRTKDAETPNTLSRMSIRASKLKQELDACEEAIKILKENPVIDRLLTLIGKIRL